MKWDSIIRNLKGNSLEAVNHHFVFIEAPQELVGLEIILWGEASWWPAKCTMKFTRKTSGELQVGTRFEQKVLMPGAPSWEVEVTKLIPNQEIERTFLNGIFIGKETVALEPRLNGMRVDYTMRYKIRGRLNGILWPLVFEKMHDQNVELILSALKDFVLRKQKHLKNK